MRPLLIWWPGASVSVSDVAAGLAAGLEAHGCMPLAFRLDQHLDVSEFGLKHAFDARRKIDPTTPTPTLADVCYHANRGVLERALRYDVEWVVMVSALYQHPDFAIMLKRAGRKVAFLGTEAPYQTEQELRLISHRMEDGSPVFDHVFVNERISVGRYREVHPSVSYLGAAAHPTRHTPETNDIDADTPAHDVVFVGTGFPERAAFFEQIDWTGINFGLYGTWELLREDSPLRAFLPKDAEGQPVLQEMVHNRRTAALYRRATVGINLHRTAVDYDTETQHVSQAQSLNPRAFELAACRKFFISDFRSEAVDVFGSDLPIALTPKGAEQLIRRALAEPVWRASVAAACHARVAGQTWRERAGQALQALAACGATQEDSRRASALTGA